MTILTITIKTYLYNICILTLTLFAVLKPVRQSAREKKSRLHTSRAHCIYYNYLVNTAKIPLLELATVATDWVDIICYISFHNAIQTILSVCMCPPLYTIYLQIIHGSYLLFSLSLKCEVFIHLLDQFEKPNQSVAETLNINYINLFILWKLFSRLTNICHDEDLYCTN